jgi:hypothetical protein
VDGAADLRLVAGVDGSQFVVELHDQRLPLAPGRSRALPSRRLSALGFVDRLHIASHGAAGNVARVEVDLADPETELLGGVVLPGDAEPLDAETAAAVEIRRMVEGDVAGVAQCVYRCYGYTYVDPSMYRPATLRSWVRAGRLHSVVAVAPDGEVVGHCALTFDRSGAVVPEAGKLVVDPRLRGHHLAERLAELRLTVAQELAVPGIWSECVTNHPYSQKEVAAFGGAETGLLMGVTPAAITMEGLENDEGGRHSLMAMWTAVAGTPPGVISVHPRHRELVGAMARATGQDRELRDVVVAPSATHSRVGSSADGALGDGALRVLEVGCDLVERVHHDLEAMASYDLAAVSLDLPLRDPGAAWAVEQLEQLGFFFGAWLPGHERVEGGCGDVLRLQRVADRPLSMDIRCARAEGEAVRDAVLAEWRRVAR